MSYSKELRSCKDTVMELLDDYQRLVREVFKDTIEYDSWFGDPIPDIDTLLEMIKDKEKAP